MPAKNDVKYFIGTTGIDLRKSNGMSEENVKNKQSDRNFLPTFVNHHVYQDKNFNGKCLTINIYIPKDISWYIVITYSYYTLKPRLGNLNTDFFNNEYLDL